MKKLNKILWGVVLITLGVLLTLNALGVTSFDLLFDGWWTLLLIVPSLIGLITERDKTGSAIGLGIGVLLLLGCQDVIGFELLWKLAIPVVIVIIGCKLIFGGLFGTRSERLRQIRGKNGLHGNTCNAIFSGQDVKMDGEVFKGAELNAIFGGIDYDLRGAIITEDCVIDVNSIFGGVDILLPAHVNVKLISHSLFGGASNIKPADPLATVTVFINANCVFGGTDVK